jgi:Protein of Unknown function (DUF2784)
MHAGLADAVLLLHLGIVVFIVGGLALVFAGNALGWAWVNRPVFRHLHGLAIGVVVGLSWLGETCPLTALESWLRARSGQAGYEAGFIQHWVHAILFFDAPAWLFTLLYTAFGGLVTLAWWRFPPRSSGRDAP